VEFVEGSVTPISGQASLPRRNMTSFESRIRDQNLKNRALTLNSSLSSLPVFLGIRL